jgi:hypothetical protein
VRLDWSADFDEERTRFHLRCFCEDCGHFDVAREACRHGWPTELHRARSISRSLPAEPASPRPLVFCKEFELC